MRSYTSVLLPLLFASGSAFASTGDHSIKTFREGPQNSGLSSVSAGKFDELFVGENRAVRHYHMGGLIWGTPVIDDDGNIYVGSSNKTFISLDKDGRLRWPKPFVLSDKESSLVDSAAALVGNLVIIPGGDGILYFLNKDTGEKIPGVEHFEAKDVSESAHQSGKEVNSFEGNVTVDKEGSIYAGSDNGSLYKLDRNGNLLWTFKTKMMIWSAPVFDKDNKWMLICSLDNHAYLVDPKTGQALTTPFDAKGEIKSSPATDGKGNIYFGTSNGDFISLKVKEDHQGAFTLVKNGSYSVGAEIYSSPAIKDNYVVFGSIDGKVRILNKRKLDHNLPSIHKVFETNSRIASSPRITADNKILIGAKNSTLYVIDLIQGTRDWSYRTTDKIWKTNLDSSPALGSDGYIHVGSYNGNLYSIPYEYCFQHRTDPQCAFGGTSDTPEIGQSTQPNLATLRFITENKEVVPSYSIGETIQLGLSVFENGNYIDNAVINALQDPSNHSQERPLDDDLEMNEIYNDQRPSSSLKVRITPHVPLQIQVSSDGRYLNISPRTFFEPGQEYTLDIRGDYYKRSHNWFWDRLNPLNWLGLNEFEAHLKFKTRPRTEGSFEYLFYTASAGQSESSVTYGLRSLYLTQPEALDTYTPAALDGQAFVSTAFALNPKQKKFIMLAIPAFPREGKDYRLAIEPSKVFTLNGTYRDNDFKGEGKFTIAGMGGEIPFNSFTFSASLNSQGEAERSEIYAFANCLGLKGSGSNYSFPSALINQICDPWARVITLGSAISQLHPSISTEDHTPLQSVEILKQKTEGASVQITLKFNSVPKEPHLFSEVQYDANTTEVLSQETRVIEPSQIATDGTVTVSLPWKWWLLHRSRTTAFFLDERIL